jgi:WD40 repeat protein
VNTGVDVAVGGSGVEILTLVTPATDVLTYDEEQKLPAPRAAWSPAGDRIATGSGDGTAQVWDAAPSSPTYGEELLALTGHTDYVLRVAWSADGSRIASADYDGRGKIWDATTGIERITLFGHKAPVTQVAWSPGGDRILTASYDGRVKVWEPDPSLLTLGGLEDLGGCVVWSPGGDRLVAAIGTGTVKVLDADASSPTFGQELLVLKDQSKSAGLCPQQWSASGDRLLISKMGEISDGPEVRLSVWDAAAGREVAALAGHSGDVWCAGWSPDGTRIISGGADDATARIWDAQTGEELLTFTGHAFGVTGVAWSPDGETIASCSFDGTAKIWDASTGEVIRDLHPEGHGSSVFALSWSPEGDRIATFAQDGTGTVWDAATGEELAALTGHAGNVATVEWSSRGDRIFTSSSDRTVRVWNPTTGAELLRYDVEGYVEAALSPDETRIAMSMGLPGLLKVFPAWQTLDELMDYARECCVVRELTVEEQEMLGLPGR